MLSLALHARTLSFDFVNFDDPTVLLAHPQLYGETSLLASLSQILFQAFPREEPLLLCDVSWAIDARVFGFQNPLGYHLGNVLPTQPPSRCSSCSSRVRRDASGCRLPLRACSPCCPCTSSRCPG